MADGTITVGTVNTNDGATVTADIPAPIGQSYVGTVNSNVALITVPESDLIDASSVEVALALVDGSNTNNDTVTLNITGPAVSCVGLLDVAASQASFRLYVRNSDGTDGASVTMPDANGSQYNMYIDRIDCEGNYVANTNPAGFMDVIAGSATESFDNFDGIFTDKFIMTAPNSATNTTSTFQWGSEGGEGEAFRLCTVQVNFLAVALTDDIDLSSTVAAGSFTDSDWAAITGLNRKFTNFEENLSVVNFRGDNWLKCDLVPSSTGSERVTYISQNMPSAATNIRTITQTVYLPPDFDFGGTADWSQHCKIGFGIAGRTGTDLDNEEISSGGFNNPESYSLRWITRGDTWKLYSYHQDTGNRTTTTGEEYPGPTAPLTGNGTPIILDREILLELQVNITAGTISGWADGVLVHSQSGLTFMNNPQTMNILTFGGWHGGSSTAWSPSTTTEFYVKNVSIVDS